MNGGELGGRNQARRRSEGGEFSASVLPKYTMKKSKLGMDLKISSSSTKSSTGGGANFAWFGRKLDGNGEEGFRRRSAVTGREKKDFSIFLFEF